MERIHRSLVHFITFLLLCFLCLCNSKSFRPGFLPVVLEKRHQVANDSVLENQANHQHSSITDRIIEAQNSFRLLDTRPTRECKNSYGPDVAMFYCPRPEPKDPLEWTCVRELQFCNGIPDCPYGEDEDPTMCMFHLAYRSEITQLKELIISLVDRQEDGGALQEAVQKRENSENFL